MPQNILLDQEQKHLIASFQILADRLNSFYLDLNNGFSSFSYFNKQVLHKFFGISKKKNILDQSCGIYLHGSVGCGKTMLMQIFYDMLKINKKIIHFQNFMQQIHTNIHQIQANNKDKIIEDLAKSISGEMKILCIDEFEINDITDAMIIMRLFSILADKKVFIFLTTNTRPDNLYKDGLQRESFLPFIANIKENFIIQEISNGKDYRLSKTFNSTKKIFFPINEETKNNIDLIKKDLCRSDEMHPGKFKVFGREVFFNYMHQNILFTNFDELFMQNFGYADYVNLCQKFKVIVLENVREIKEDETDVIIRFINFIDNAYFNKILLFASLVNEPSLLYRAGKRQNEFKRTVSRLYEENW